MELLRSYLKHEDCIRDEIIRYKENSELLYIRCIAFGIPVETVEAHVARSWQNGIRTIPRRMYYELYCPREGSWNAKPLDCLKPLAAHGDLELNIKDKGGGEFLEACISKLEELLSTQELAVAELYVESEIDLRTWRPRTAEVHDLCKRIGIPHDITFELKMSDRLWWSKLAEFESSGLAEYVKNIEIEIDSTSSTEASVPTECCDDHDRALYKPVLNCILWSLSYISISFTCDAEADFDEWQHMVQATTHLLHHLMDDFGSRLVYQVRIENEAHWSGGFMEEKRRTDAMKELVDELCGLWEPYIAS